MTPEPITLVAPPSAKQQTVQQFLGDYLPLEPMEVVARIVTGGHVTVDGQPLKRGQRLDGGETVLVTVPENRELQKVEVVRSDLLYQDADLLIWNKPANCTVIPERHRLECPFKNGVLAWLRGKPEVAAALIREHYRPRTLHRLDRDTTGAVVVAISRQGELRVSAQFQDQTIQKEYFAMLVGELPDNAGAIDAPISEVEEDLARMQIDERHGKPARTEFEVVERFRGFTLVRAYPKTGRRHQLRLHFAHIGYPILADRVYGGGTALMLSSIKRRYRSKSDAPEKGIISRSALHAAAITFRPVGTETPVRVEAPLPKDYEVLLKMLRKYARGGQGAAAPGPFGEE